MQRPPNSSAAGSSPGYLTRGCPAARARSEVRPLSSLLPVAPHPVVPARRNEPIRLRPGSLAGSSALGSARASSYSCAGSTSPRYRPLGYRGGSAACEGARFCLPRSSRWCSSPASALAAITIDSIRFGPSGDDDGSNASLNGEYLVIENTAGRAVQLEGWTIRDADRHVYTCPRLRLGPGKKVRLHTGAGDDGRQNIYWGQDNYVWNNDGDRATLKDEGGHRVDVCSYSGSGSTAGC